MCDSRNFTFPGTSMTVDRMGYGAMQLAGPHVFGPPKDRAACVAVLREAVESGVNHIDTSDFYGPHVTNQIIKEALHPYKDGLVIVTKVGATRGSDGSWITSMKRDVLVNGVHDNLRNLGLDALDVVNLRNGGLERPDEGSLAEPLAVLAELKEQGLIKHIGLSQVTPEQFAEAEKIMPIVCVQNLYNVAKRGDDEFVKTLEKKGVAYVPYFPLGGFTPLQSSELDSVAGELNATPMQVALAWLLQRSSNMLLIPGTSSVGHLRENLAAANILLSPEVVARLDAIGG
ncbi:aryl-alcohol dehydrogenase-like predicted oxidoreductase [Granulicella aggregans]|uniref:Aryl-alcohol dehydrogenase-like predicted oxidoreductase n=1 Tax=Granulicella aggregans TaxID=474949 RepID=A0A7W8E2N8_9BACT|nr:aldo/keto reductase family oxidoreductase [Granulicella aggregans]MBB5056732.1 aryl-alcohol dehydrogenase-like predicted oxidoreductase [Granulicella aggregans]